MQITTNYFSRWGLITGTRLLIRHLRFSYLRSFWYPSIGGWRGEGVEKEASV